MLQEFKRFLDFQNLQDSTTENPLNTLGEAKCFGFKKSDLPKIQRFHANSTSANKYRHFFKITFDQVSFAHILSKHF